MKYTVTLPDGSTKTRQSHRTYTHAIAVRYGSEWRVTAFCGSAELAGKEMATQQRMHTRLSQDKHFQSYQLPDEYRILPAVAS